MNLPITPSLTEWLTVPSQSIAAWIQFHAPDVVMGLPLDGTRRWYLTHIQSHPDAPDYLTLLIRRQAELQRMVFDHGVQTLLTPCYAKKILDRGEQYAFYALNGMLQLLEDPVYQTMVGEGVRIDFYGDYVEIMDRPAYRHILEACLAVRDAAAHGQGPLLLLGFFADEPYETIARLSVTFAAAHGRPPNRRELIRAYYGYDLADLSLYVSYGKARIFSVPLLTTGVESLYTTLYPTPDLGERQLREILYDHLIARQITEVEYADLSPEGRQSIVRSVLGSSGKTLGLGNADPLTGKWIPRFS